MTVTAETYTLTDAAPGPVICSVDVYRAPSHLNRDPEVVLRAVIFADGCEVHSDRQHAVQVHMRGDRLWKEHLAWCDVERRCEEEFRKGESVVAEAFDVLLGRKAA